MRRHVLLACLAVALASIPALPTTAHADDPLLVEAQARFAEGVELADAGKHEAARLKFQQAYAVHKVPTILYNLARAEQLTGHDVEALEHFRLFLRVGGSDPKITDAMREKAVKQAKDLTHVVGQVEIDAPTTARVSLDGRTLEGVARDPIPVKPGKHTIEAVQDGKTKTFVIDCPAGSVVKTKIEFDVESSTQPPPPPEEAPSGWSTGRIVTVSALSAGAVAGGILGFVFFTKASSNVDDVNALRARRPCELLDSKSCRDARAENDSIASKHRSNTTLGAVSVIAGGAFAAGAIAAALFWPTKSSSAARLVPTVTPGYSGATMVGTF